MPLDGEDACVVLVWHAQTQNPALRALRKVLHEISRNIDLSS